MVDRVLWVTSEPPDFGHQGGTIRQAHLLRGLARHAEVDLVVAGRLTDTQVRADVRLVREVAVPEPRSSWEVSKTHRRIRSLWGALRARTPSTVQDERSRVRALAPVLREMLAAEPYSAVVVQHTGLTPLHVRRAGVRWVAEIHNAVSITAEQRLALARSRRERWLLRRELRQARQLEAWIGARYDAVIAVSDEDAAVLGPRAVVVANGVDSTRLLPTPLPSEPRMLFVGTLSYFPNADGIVWFCDHVLPLVRERVPGAELDIVGRTPAPEVAALAAREGVRVHADVPDVQPFLDRTRVCVVPLRFGSGTRLKALEAAAAGRPVAGTAIGLGGIDFVDGLTARIADGPDELADAVVALLTPDGDGASISVAARRLVEDKFDWCPLGRAYAGHVLGASAGP